MANSTEACPAPFLDLSHFTGGGGYVNGRFCGQISKTLTCCLPCPLVQWLYPDWLFHSAKVASWFNVPALICQVVLLLTFFVLPQEKVHGRYLSVGLCVSLILLELAFIIPIGVKPNQCYDAITPKDMHSSLTCAWTGALLETGSMGATVWILLRSLYTHLRVCWDVDLTSRFVWVAHFLGWGLPLLFLTISLSVTGLSYRLIPTCSPNPSQSFLTWFGWLIAFALLSAIIQFGTTAFCLVVYARSLFKHHSTETQFTPKSPNSTAPSAVSSQGETSASATTQNVPWKRAQKIILLQWRSILLSLVVICIAAYAGIVYVVMTRTAQEDANPSKSDNILNWTNCLVYHNGNKDKCLHLAKPLRLGADQVAAALIMASLIGIFTFGLMVRWSMVTAWIEFIRNPRGGNRRNSLGFDLASPGGTKHMSLSRPLASELALKEALPPTPTTPAPEPGDVAKRHKSILPFDFDFESQTGKGPKDVDQDDVV